MPRLITTSKEFMQRARLLFGRNAYTSERHGAYEMGVWACHSLWAVGKGRTMDAAYYDALSRSTHDPRPRKGGPR